VTRPPFSLYRGWLPLHGVTNGHPQERGWLAATPLDIYSLFCLNFFNEKGMIVFSSHFRYLIVGKIGRVLGFKLILNVSIKLAKLKTKV